MRSSNALLVLALAVLLCLPAQAKTSARKAPPKLSAEEIVRRHVAARGGLTAWHAVQSMIWSGKMDVGFADSAARSARYVSNAMLRKGKAPRLAKLAAAGEENETPKEQVQVPFRLEMKRPERSRIEIQFAGKTAVQIFDGTNGWMFRPYLNREDWQPFTAEQARSQQGKWELDGPVLDAAEQGTRVKLLGVEKVDGHDAWKLALTHKGGEVQHVWIDAKTFLDVKVEGTPRRLDGKLRTVSVTQRDFRTVQGLQVPFVLETAVDGYPDTHRMVLEKASVNSPLDDARFAKPRA